MDITFKNLSLNIKTKESSAVEPADIVIVENSPTTKFKSIVSVKGKFELKIALYWSHFSDDIDVSFHYSEHDCILFIGAGSVSSVIDLSSSSIIDINYPELFGAWECIGDHILELGELECRLYNKSGELIGNAHVDPPYDYSLTDMGISFSSIVMGKTEIMFG